MSARVAVAAIAVALGACGSRTPLDVDLVAGDGDVDASFDASIDAPDAPVDAPIDARADADAGGCASSCDDGVACTRDACDARKMTCTHTPDDALCPPGLLCNASGCGVFAYAVTINDITEVALPGGAVSHIGPNAFYLSDIGLHPNGTLYGVADQSSQSAFFTVDRATGTATYKGTIDGGINGLDVAPNGTVYASGYTAIYEVDPVGPSSKVVAPMPSPWRSSGDLVVVGGRVLVSVTQGLGMGTDSLLELDPIARTTRIVGDIGFRCVYGLAAFGPTLYGLTCEGNILVIDQTTGRGAMVARSSASFNGATAR